VWFCAFFCERVIFYHTMLCVSAVFAVTQCLSVTLVHCIQMAEDIVKFLSRPSSPIILVFFDSERLYPISRGNPSAVTQNTLGLRKFAVFDWDHRLSRKRYSCYGMLIGNHRLRIDTCQFWWTWVTLTRVSRSLYSYKSNISKTVCLRDKVTIVHLKGNHTQSIERYHFQWSMISGQMNGRQVQYIVHW